MFKFNINTRQEETSLKDARRLKEDERDNENTTHNTEIDIEIEVIESWLVERGNEECRRNDI
jgi:hypothetical protein